MFTKIYDLLSSRKITVFTSIIFSVFATLLVVFAVIGVPRTRLMNISTMLPYKFLYALLLINMFVCTLRAIPRAIKRSKFSKEDILPLETVKSQKSAVQIEVDNSKLEGAGEIIKPITFSDDGNAAYCLKNRFDPFGSVFFHLSFFLIAFGILFSNQTRFVGDFSVVEGLEFTGGQSEYDTIFPEKHGYFRVGNPPEFKVKKAHAKFWKDWLLFTDLAYDIEYGNGKEATIRMNKPAKINDHAVYVLGYNYAPFFKLFDKKGVEIDQSTVQLSAFPPGQVDSFQLLEDRYTVELAILPDYKKINNGIEIRTFNLIQPGYLVKIKNNRREKILFNGFVEQGEKIRFDDRMISFPELKIYGQFRSIRDKGLAYVWLGTIIGCISIVIRIIFRQKRIWMATEKVNNNTKLYIFGQSEFFSNLFQIELKKLSDKLRNTYQKNK